MSKETQTINPAAETSFVYPADNDDSTDWEIIQRGDEGLPSTKLVMLYDAALTQADVLKEMDRIVANITKQGPVRPPLTPEQIVKDGEQKNQLGNILHLIKSLCHGVNSPDGKNFATPAPTQFLHRRKAPTALDIKPPKSQSGTQWAEDPRVINDDDEWKFNSYPGTHTPTPESLEKNTPFWSLADLLGLFFTKLGPSPPDATPLNFFLPLTALYARWTKVLMPNQLTSLSSQEVFEKYPPHPTNTNPSPPERSTTGRGPKAPYMCQCTWAINEAGTGGSANFALGSSINGHHKILEKTMIKHDHSCKRLLLLRRFTNLHAVQRYELMRQNGAGGAPIETFNVQWGYEKATSKHEFGNCAETYPFIQFFTNPIESTNVMGFSLIVNAINKTSKYSSSHLLKRKTVNFPGNKDELFKFICSPCANCQFLVDNADSDVSGEFFPAVVFPQDSGSIQ